MKIFLNNVLKSLGIAFIFASLYFVSANLAFLTPSNCAVFIACFSFSNIILSLLSVIGINVFLKKTIKNVLLLNLYYIFQILIYTSFFIISIVQFNFGLPSSSYLNTFILSYFIFRFLNFCSSLLNFFKKCKTCLR